MFLKLTHTAYTCQAWKAKQDDIVDVSEIEGKRLLNDFPEWWEVSAGPQKDNAADGTVYNPVVEPQAVTVVPVVDFTDVPIVDTSQDIVIDNDSIAPELRDTENDNLFVDQQLGYT